MQKIRAIVVDDHPAIRHIIRAALSEAADIEVIAALGQGDQALKLAIELCPDVLVLDLNLPGIDGDEIGRRLAACDSPVRILLMSATSDPSFVRQIIQGTPWGFLPKEKIYTHLIDAVRRMSQGESGWLGDQPRGVSAVKTG